MASLNMSSTPDYQNYSATSHMVTIDPIANMDPIGLGIKVVAFFEIFVLNRHLHIGIGFFSVVGDSIVQVNIAIVLEGLMAVIVFIGLVGTDINLDHIS